MNEKLDRLRDIGAQKIYEDTHIPVEHVQAIIHESFEGFSKVQFLGFLSILEREYKEDLSSIRLAGLEYFGEKRGISQDDDSLFVTTNHKKSYTIFYILLAAVIFSLAFYFTVDSSNKIEEMHSNTLDNTVIEDAQKNIIDSNESNASSLSNTDENATHEDENFVFEEEVVAPQTLSIVAKTKVWAGYIELDTNKHYQKIFQGELTLDPSKDWLLVFGHGFIDIVLNDKIQKFKTINKVRFLYKDGEINAITNEEFKQLNRGRLW